MNRQELLAEIDRLNQEIERLKEEIQDGYREIPEARKVDRNSMKMLRMNMPRYVFTDAEAKLNKYIAENRKQLDDLRTRVSELKAQLRSSSTGGGPLGVESEELQLVTDGLRQEGTVKHFDPDPAKNFGFITVPGQPDVFVHGSALAERGQLERGDKVTFKRVSTAKGFKAVDVRFVPS